MPHDGKVLVVASDAEEATNETGKQRYNLPKYFTTKGQLDTLGRWFSRFHTLRHF